ncbi:uncharacterized protein FIBRA_06371 [Fibroporia radiculosa]|uniref:PCI domain-containing protein n=1 Tax=Fibroporia radiculosa TaxID=599839 RepID=J4GSM1_9APHY|nr:uncharacterized protein FIBRA_06371 [Fibroporia radiculosa]CCM04205.1 predicted protein [Fibroporia radiculosa]
MSSSPNLSRRSSLADRIASAIPPIRPRLPSLRSRKSNLSASSLNAQVDLRQGSYYRPYSVYQQTMFPVILRDADATNKLLESILDGPGGRRSLGRLARTCNALKEPVLDILWRDLDTLTPLIGLFPSTILKRARRPGLGLTKNPEPSDWNRLLAYGERVRSVSYVEASGNISPTIFPILEELCPKPWILPNLTSLTWKSETAAGLERCRLFMCPELRNLTLEVGTKHPRLHDLLMEIASHTKLSSFSFTIHTNLPDNFTDIFEHNVALEKVAIAAPGALSSRVGSWAASLPNLRSFQIDLTGRTSTAVEGFFDDIIPGSGYSTPSSVGGTDSGVFSADEFDFSEMRKSAVHLTRDGPGHGAFAQLTQLQLSGEVSNIATFLRHITSPLSQLELVIDDPPASEDWHDVCELVCDQFSHTLQVFRVSPTSASKFNELVRSTSRGGETPTRHLPLTYLGPLPHLHRLDIDLPESVIFRDADIIHLARICPSLEILRLCPLARFSQAVGPPSLTMESLAHLTRACPRLHTLAAVINALEGSEEIFDTHAVSSRSLLRLNVGHSWIKDPFQAAVLLSHLAPYLESVKWFHEKNRAGAVETNALAWQKVSEFLPHLQNIRLLERRHQPQPQVYVPPQTAEKEVDATVLLIDEGVLAQPELVEEGIQVTVEAADFSVQVEPEMASVSIDATPVLVDTGSLVIPCLVEHAVQASVESESSSKADVLSHHIADFETTKVDAPSILSYLPSPALGLMSLTSRVVRFYTLPFRYMFSLMPAYSQSQNHSMQITGDLKDMIPGGINDEIVQEKQHNGTNLANSDVPQLDTAYDYAYSNENESTVLQAGNSLETDAVAVRAEIRQGHVRREFLSAQKGSHETGASATRQSNNPDTTTRTARQLALPISYSTYAMAENRKQEKDYTKEVDELLPEAKSLAQSGKVQAALDKLFSLEKQTRNASDAASTTRLVRAICEICYEARDYALLNSSINNLSKKHGQLKASTQAIVEQAMGWLDDIRKREGDEKWLELIETLRTVTEGKILLETPRARVTLQLTLYHESLVTNPKSGSTSTPKEILQTAADLLSDLQVETYSSMERREKTEFILEQMRLLIALARIKDAEVGQEGKKDSIGGGEAEWVKVRVGGRKVNESFLKEKENEDLRFKYYDMMIQYALKQSAYLDAAKHYHKVWETPSVKEDVVGRGREALEHIVYYVVLAPHDNEQSDMLHRLFKDPALEKLELHYALIKCFTTPELMRWPGIESIYGPHLRKTSIFTDDKLWEDLHTRVIEHNIRIIAQYYTRITLPRLTSLLDLTQREAEEILCRLVVSGTVWARIDRPTDIINFRSSKSAEDVMNDWSSDMQRLLGLVEKTWMGVNAAQAAQSRAVKA